MNRTQQQTQAEAYLCATCGDRGYGGWNCLQCGSYMIERREELNDQPTEKDQ